MLVDKFVIYTLKVLILLTFPPFLSQEKQILVYSIFLKRGSTFPYVGRVRLRLRVCTPSPTRYLTFLRVISIKMARAYAEGVTISVQMGLERCGFNKSSEGKGKG